MRPTGLMKKLSGVFTDRRAVGPSAIKTGTSCVNASFHMSCFRGVTLEYSISSTRNFFLPNSVVWFKMYAVMPTPPRHKYTVVGSTSSNISSSFTIEKKYSSSVVVINMPMKNEIFQLVVCCTLCAIMMMSYVNTMYPYDPRDVGEEDQSSVPYTAAVPQQK